MALAGGCSSDGGLSCQRIQALLEWLHYAVREIDADTRRVLPRVMNKYFAFFLAVFPTQAGCFARSDGGTRPPGTGAVDAQSVGHRADFCP